jgi:hypothetical protein
MRDFRFGCERKTAGGKTLQSLTLALPSALATRQDGAAAPFFCFKVLGMGGALLHRLAGAA